MKRTTLVLALFAWVFSAPRVARATPGFPAEIEAHLAIATAPPCGLCHTTGSLGGRGTVNTPFGRSARAHGLVEFDNAALDAALDAMAKDGTDSDGDGVPDITELERGTDPNTPDATDGGAEGGTNAASAAPEPPQYGCAMRPTRSARPTRTPGTGSANEPRDAGSAVAAVLAGLCVIRARSRRARRASRAS